MTPGNILPGLFTFKSFLPKTRNHNLLPSEEKKEIKMAETALQGK